MFFNILSEVSIELRVPLGRWNKELFFSEYLFCEKIPTSLTWNK